MGTTTDGSGLEDLPWVAGSLADRLGAMVGAVVMADRWATHHGIAAAAEDRGWQGRVWGAWAEAVAPGGDRGTGVLVQELKSPPAVALALLPHLWQQADALGQRRTVLAQTLADLPIAEEAMIACLDLHRLLGAGTAAAGPAGSSWARGGWGRTLGPAIALVAQTQGQWTPAVAIARRRGWDGAAIALLGGLAGWVGGPASLAAAQRRRWLSPAAVADPWGGAEGDRLDDIAQTLYCQWAGVRAAGVDQVRRL